jgi:coproporphyrinogen III oxidase
MFQDNVVDWLKQLQDAICNSLESLDGRSRFEEDAWEREEGGGGRSRVLANSETDALFEKAGVNFSLVHGKTPSFLEREILDMPGLDVQEVGDISSFMATGVSLVIHPRNPRVPIIHMNVRYFRVNDSVQWFGGGIDLTPVYVVEEDAKFFHRTLKSVCDKHNPLYYPEFKKWADDYFFIRHRNETRGVGGIFFDRLIQNQDISLQELFLFLQDVGNTFVPVYSEIVRRNKDLKFSNKEEEWQLLRRGRYAEFNLVYDRGTRFGLKTGGRTESILMSLPPRANWTYDVKPEINSEEEKTIKCLKKGIDWIA